MAICRPRPPSFFLLFFFHDPPKLSSQKIFKDRTRKKKMCVRSNFFVWRQSRLGELEIWNLKIWKRGSKVFQGHGKKSRKVFLNLHFS